ncbi:MAG: biotin attachment protein [Cytophagaceae bacterium]|nr:biotin attachment protein [Gemmatimonadaceae bacterium]
MKYAVDVNGTRIDLSLAEGGVQLGGTFVAAHLGELEGTPVQLVELEGEVHRVVVRAGDTRGSYTLWIGGHRYQVEALDERTRTIRELTAGASKQLGPRPLVAPMPGLVVRIHVELGDHVEAGQGLVAMEAMKMENELRSPSAGTVVQIHARLGQAVEKGALLVELA